MSQSLAQKIISRAAGRPEVAVGEIVVARVDLAMMHDSGGPRRVWPRLKELGARIWDPERVVLVSDHFVPAVDAESAEILALTRRFAAEFGIRRFHDMQGICHVVLQEYGHLRPGMFAVGGDSHSPSGGAVGAFMIGIGATDMLAVLITGETWLRVPETWQVLLDAPLPQGVCAKDVMLKLLADLGMANEYVVFEYQGPGVAAMPMEERFVLCNMSAELGGKTGIVPPDETTLAALAANGVEVDAAWLSLRSDPEAVSRQIVVQAGALAPLVAKPHSPAQAEPVERCAGERIDQAYIGACTGAKLSDLRMAAAVLRGRRVAPGTRLLVAPASQRTWQAAAADGTLRILSEAGAILLPSGCGACAGLGAGLLAAGETCIASTARNFKGRMGSPEASVFLGSPYTVAASAIAGRIADPREFL
ncbi:MAG: 3-isopropylmalate dehydratase large subunit [Lysobacterales bacterium]|jgi:3-isopropylmalate/(R)-2-methylmalate dehydratase large subunit|nr:MAG: 3-isopropylmalate dehydratase large subunit [Xanthomonadales bacterium]